TLRQGYWYTPVTLTDLAWDTETWDDETPRVLTVGRPGRLVAMGRAGRFGELAIGDRPPERDPQEAVPDGSLKRRPAQIEPELEARPLAFPVGVELLDHVEVGTGVRADPVGGEMVVEPHEEVRLGLVREREAAEPVARRSGIGRAEGRREGRPVNGIGGRHGGRWAKSRGGARAIS